MSFNDAQQPTARAWAQALRAMPAARAIWELPLIGSQPRLLLGIIRNALRRERPDTSARRTTVPIFADTKTLEAALSIATHADVWVGVISSTGAVVGGVSDARTDDSGTRLDRFSAACMPGTATPHLLVTDGGFRPDGTFVSWPVHDTARLTGAFRRAVLTALTALTRDGGHAAARHAALRGRRSRRTLDE